MKDFALRKSSLIKLLILALSLVLCFLAWRFLPVRHYLADAQRMKNALQHAGIWAPLLFITVSSILIAVGVGRLIFCGLGGATFGFVQGFLYAQVATLAGSYLSFLYSRWLGREWLKGRFRNYERFNKYFQKSPFLSMIVLRQLPIGGIVLNLILGLTTMGHVTFLIGSAIGFVPEAVVFTLLGSGIFKSNFQHAAWQVSLALLFFLLCLWGIWRVHKSSVLNRELETEVERLNDDSRGDSVR